MYAKVKSIIEEALHLCVSLETPRNKSLGHFALPTFSFAKTLKKSPQSIAQEFAVQLEKLPQIQKIEVINGYVNLTLSKEFLAACAWEFLQHKTTKTQVASKGRILLEYVSANPTGPLHIGHARGAVFGDSLARIGRFLGYTIHTEYYVNDAGAQIKKLGSSIYYAGRHLIYGESKELPNECYQGEYIFKLAQNAREDLGDALFESLESLEALSTFGRNKMLEEIKQNLAQIGIHFDAYVSEKSLFSKWDSTVQKLQANGGLFEDNGKLWLKSTAYGDEKDRVIVRESGEATYLAADIIYHNDKFERNFDGYINVWGADHHGYINRIKAAIAFLGFQSEKLEVLLTQMVALLKNGEAYKVSKRAGNFVLMKDVVEDVGYDALRLMFLSKKQDTHLEFDVSDLQKQDASNPVYYIHYAHARIHTLFTKSSTTMQSLECLNKEQFIATFRQDNIKEDLCHLLVLALGLPKVLNDAFEQRLINKVVDYLYALAGELHHFYTTTKILNTKGEKETLAVLAIVAHSIALGLELLGIKAKISM